MSRRKQRRNAKIPLTCRSVGCGQAAVSGPYCKTCAKRRKRERVPTSNGA